MQRRPNFPFRYYLSIKSHYLELKLPSDFAKYSVRNRSGIIAQHGVSNAKPLTVDLILRLPEKNF